MSNLSFIVFSCLLSFILIQCYAQEEVDSFMPKFYGVPKFGPPVSIAEMMANPAKNPYGTQMSMMPFVSNAKLFWFQSPTNK
ncbi:hypothetical protein BLOT_004227 [Blomia tropicalis]|nr:hypothetical protein BLOT_004227 [Blomia tropicalis]